MTQTQRLDAGAPGALEARAASHVRDDDGDRGVEPAVADRVDERLQVAAAARDEHAQAAVQKCNGVGGHFRGHSLPLTGIGVASAACHATQTAFYYDGTRLSRRQPSSQTRVAFREAATTRFRAILRAAANRFAIAVFAYCVMPNHWHIVADSPARWRALSLHALVDDDPRATLANARGPEGQGAVYQGRFRRSRLAETGIFFGCADTSKAMRCGRLSWIALKTGRGPVFQHAARQPDRSGLLNGRRAVLTSGCAT